MVSVALFLAPTGSKVTKSHGAPSYGENAVHSILDFIAQQAAFEPLGVHPISRLLSRTR